MDAIEIESSDVIKLILQFLRENNLNQSAQALQLESQVSLNAVENVSSLVQDISTGGQWGRVMQQSSFCQLSSALMTDLYEHIFYELLEAQETETAKQLLQRTPPMIQMRTENPERFLRLERLTHRAIFDVSDVYGGGGGGATTKEKKRKILADAVKQEIAEVPPSRLLTMLGQSLKWQNMQGMIPPGTQYDFFRNAPKRRKIDREDRLVKKNVGKIKFGKKSFPQCVDFTLDGQMLISGSKDGFIEVWDFDKCRIRKDLSYQAKDEFMMHDTQVTCMALSANGELLATGSSNGQAKIWKISSGQCLRRFEKAHSASINCISFSRDGSQILTGSYDNSLKIHGLKSGQTLKEFHGHSGYVNSAIFSSDGSKIISVSCSGEIKIWNFKTAECLNTFSPPTSDHGVEVDIVSVSLLPKSLWSNSTFNPDDLLICCRSPVMHILSISGKVLKTFSNASDFSCCTMSPHGKWLYGVTEDKKIVCFSTESGSIESTLTLTEDQVLGITHHPHQNLLATYGNNSYLRFWRPK